MPAEQEPCGLFGHLFPQQALTRLQQHQRSQVLRPDLWMDIPTVKVRTSVASQPRGRPLAPGQAAPAAPLAPLPLEFSGSHIAEIKVLGKGVKNHYKIRTAGSRVVDSRAAGIPADYRWKAAVMNAAMGVPEGEEGPCQRRLAELPLITLAWGRVRRGQFWCPPVGDPAGHLQGADPGPAGGAALRPADGAGGDEHPSPVEYGGGARGQ